MADSRAVVLLAAALALLAAPSVRGNWASDFVSKVDGLQGELKRKEDSLLEAQRNLTLMLEIDKRAHQRFVTRAAIDVGSAACKLQVAEVDLLAEGSPAIVRVVHEEKVNLLLAEDLEKSGTGEFSDEAMEELGQVLADLKHAAAQHGAEQVAGVATAAFRKARNGFKHLAEVRTSRLFWVGLTQSPPQMSRELGMKLRVVDAVGLAAAPASC
eukprot:751083-Hanusia_phi.AAC.6